MKSVLRGSLQIIGAAVCLVVANAGAQAATFITGSSDPDYNTAFQGASAATFDGLGYTVGTGPGQLRVSIGTFTDPSGLIFGQLTANANVTSTGVTTNKLTDVYSQPSGLAKPGDARDYNWIQNSQSNSTSNPALDQPWVGNVFDLGGQANKAVVFPIIDHGPLPYEAVEYTVYLGNNPTSTNLLDWHVATLQEVYLQGWEADSTSLADGFTTVWALSNPADTFRYVSVAAVGSQSLALPSICGGTCGTDDEIDAVAGLTVGGTGVGTVPEPGTLMLVAAAVAAGLGMRRRVIR